MTCESRNLSGQTLVLRPSIGCQVEHLATGVLSEEMEAQSLMSWTRTSLFVGDDVLDQPAYWPKVEGRRGI
jgi:hypothetical protein